MARFIKEMPRFMSKKEVSLTETPPNYKEYNLRFARLETALSRYLLRDIDKMELLEVLTKIFTPEVYLPGQLNKFFVVRRAKKSLSSKLTRVAIRKEKRS